MHFDASPRLMQSLAEQLRQDNRVLKWTTLKLGERLQDIIRTKEQTVVYGKANSDLDPV